MAKFYFISIDLGNQPMLLHEEQFVRSFIVPEKRERYLAMLESEKGRAKLLAGFYHLRDLDERLGAAVPPREQGPEKICEILRSKGAPDVCYVMSTNAALDGTELALIDVLNEIVGSGDGTFISCIPGKLGYYEGEGPGRRYVFETI